MGLPEQRVGTAANIDITGQMTAVYIGMRYEGGQISAELHCNPRQASDIRAAPHQTGVKGWCSSDVCPGRAAQDYTQ